VVDIRILVVDALARASGSKYTSFDVVGSGPRLIAGLIKDRGFNVDLKSYELFMESPRMDYDLVLFSIMSSDIGALRKGLNKLRETGFKGKVIVGGPASLEYDRILKNFNDVDYVVVGEGEIPLMRILEDIDGFLDGDISILENIPALAFREDGKVVLTTSIQHTPVEIINSLKPWVEIQESYKHYRVLRYYVEVLRGCSNFQRPRVTGIGGLNCVFCNQCSSTVLEHRLNCPSNIPPGCGFCSVPYVFGYPRSRSIESVVDEIKGLIRNGARRIVLSAPDFLDYGRELLVKPSPLTNPCSPPANYEAIEQLLSEIYSIPEVENGRVRVHIENIKACLVDEEIARILSKYLKGTTVHIGLETGDDKYNEYVLGKPIGSKHVIEAVKLLSRYGLRPYVYIMYGLPLMNREVYIKTIKTTRKLFKLGVEKITLYKYVKLPGTAFQNIDYDVKGCEKYVEILKKLVRRFNLEAKKRFLKSRIKVYLMEDDGKYYGYPVDHGPVVFVKGLNKPGYDNCLAIVEIYDISERNLWGRLIEIVEC